MRAQCKDSPIVLPYFVYYDVVWAVVVVGACIRKMHTEEHSISSFSTLVLFLIIAVLGAQRSILFCVSDFVWGDTSVWPIVAAAPQERVHGELCTCTLLRSPDRRK